jgi:hypothetical protein
MIQFSLINYFYTKQLTENLLQVKVEIRTTNHINPVS